jgi:hypothetical protein
MLTERAVMLASAVKKDSSEDNSMDIELAVAALIVAEKVTQPFTHWLFEDALPVALCQEILRLPIDPPSIEDTHGKRDSHNNLRRFFSPGMQAEYNVMRETAELFQSKAIVKALEALCGIDFTGSHLRIEYCQDRDGFWLEPHMDIKEKLITMQIYLNTGADAATLGTDIYDNTKKPYSIVPSMLGQGMIFIPKEPNSWHGFEKRPIQTVRRSLIINYVTDDWRARHELAFPENPIT